MEGEARTDEEDVRDAKETEGRYKSMRVLRNIATKLAVATIGARLLAAAAFGAEGTSVNVALPAAVRIGDTTLASGAYRITEVTDPLLMIGSDQDDAAIFVTAIRSLDLAAEDRKTEVVLSPDEEGILHLDKMFAEGDSAGYQFIGLK